jgi:hypothetical protein
VIAHRRARALGLPLAALLALAGCVPGPERPAAPPAAGMPADYPLGVYRQALEEGRAVYGVDTGQSEILIRLYRGGSLAHMGHNHTVASRDVRGYAIVGGEPEGTRFDLYFPVADLIVDDPADRARAGEGFDKPLSDKAIEGTRENMLGEDQLDAAAHPFISVAGRVVSRAGAPHEARLSLSVRGQTTSRTVPVDLKEQGDRLIASGALGLRLTELDIEPYSVLGGALKVEDAIDLEFEIVASRATDALPRGP